jgi:hypothetical protein
MQFVNNFTSSLGSASCAIDLRISMKAYQCKPSFEVHTAPFIQTCLNVDSSLPRERTLKDYRVAPEALVTLSYFR